MGARPYARATVPQPASAANVDAGCFGARELHVVDLDWSLSATMMTPDEKKRLLKAYASLRHLHLPVCMRCLACI